jgi:hypothetical protein
LRLSFATLSIAPGLTAVVIRDILCQFSRCARVESGV